MDTDRYFNLQLTIQKLEEELSLYRNGTTGQELLDLIKEKDTELGATKTDLINTSSELATVKNNFSTLIKSSRKTLADNESLKTQHQQAQAALTALTAEHAVMAASLASTTKSLTDTETALQVASEKLASSCQQNQDDAAMISKLQEQGIAYVKKLNCQYSQAKESEKQIKILEVTEQIIPSSSGI
jgi:chromosome segregation ATPase